MLKYSQQLRVPHSDPYFYLTKNVIMNLDRMAGMAKKQPVNILVTGKQGCGKSSLIRQFASRHNRSLATFQVGLLSEPGQLFGEQSLKGGETYFQEFLFPQAITTPRMVIHLEEINRPEHPKALNELFSVLSEDRSIWVDKLGLVEVAEDVVFFASLNEGPEFTGVDILDAALKDRFYTIPMDYLPRSIEEKVLVSKTGCSEEQAFEIMRIIFALRTDAKNPVSISTRHSLMIAELAVAGASLRDAFLFSLQIDKDALESCLLSLHFDSGEMGSEDESYELF